MESEETFQELQERQKQIEQLELNKEDENVIKGLKFDLLLDKIDLAMSLLQEKQEKIEQMKKEDEDLQDHIFDKRVFQEFMD